ncbi:DNA internalization-related competence protein ComEC/Rec2 [Colwelliaceae bacterium BS250]
MERCLLFFIIGALSALLLPKVPPLYYLLCMLLSCIYLFFFTHHQKVLMFFIGFGYLLAAAHNHFSWATNNNIDISQLIVKPVIISGRIKSLITDTKNLRFKFQVETINHKTLEQPFLIRLNWQQKYTSITLDLAQSNIVQLLVKLKPVHGFANSGMFSYQRWLLQRHIAASGYVKSSVENKVLLNKSSLRQRLYWQLQPLVEHLPLKGLLLALAIGDKSLIEQQQWQILKATGTQHLMAISGLHLGLIAGFGVLLAKLMLNVIPNNLLQGRVERYLFLMPVLFSLILACFYAYLAGFATPTIRALVMLCTFWLLRCGRCKVSYIRWLLLSISVIILLEPFALLDMGFYLSVFAVSAILFMVWRYQHVIEHANQSRLAKLGNFLKSLVLVQIAISLLLLPLTALFFGQITLLSPLANIVVVPFLSVTTIPLMLLATIICSVSTSGSAVVISVAAQCLELAWYYLSYLQGLDFLVFDAGKTSLYVALCAPIFLLVYSCRLLPLKILLWIFSVLLLSVVGTQQLQQQMQQKQQHWQLVVFDVGHGLAILIVKNQRALLYDTGAKFASGFNISKAIVVPYLHKRNIRKLDKVIISHSDNDHAGGLHYLVEERISNDFLLNFAEGENISKCQVGASFAWQGLTFNVLWPLPAGAVNDNRLSKKKSQSDNDKSCVIEVSDGQQSVLLTGDISKKVEQQLKAMHKLNPVDILVVPHHGSKTSSSVEFIEVLAPKYAIYSTGFLNRWHMPVPAVVQVYNNAQVQQFNTAEQGMLLFDLSTKGIKVRTYRDDFMPFWPWQQLSQYK